jgi:uncharacterized protein YkwD
MTLSRLISLSSPVLAALLLNACASKPVKSANWATTEAVNQIAKQLFDGVNDYRANEKINRLKRHEGLDRLAQQHCEFLRKHRGTFSEHGKNVSHMGAEYRESTCLRRYQMNSYGENVAAISSHPKNIAQHTITLWIASKDHQINMISKWTYTGMGVVVDEDGTVFATQIFTDITPPEPVKKTNHA